MKSKKKVLGLVLCAVLLVVGSVMGTLAYLQSQDAVKNTFTVGSVIIEMDETDVDLYGEKDSENRVKANQYKLVPGHEYTKDPVVHVKAPSEPSYVFVKVKNDIAALEAKETIAEQMNRLGWKALDGGVFYYDGIYANMSIVDAREGQIDLVVFEKFTLLDDANVTGLVGEDGTVDEVITIDAYAIQADGFDSPEDAWNAVK